MELGYIVWDVSRELFTLGSLRAHYYGLFWAIGLLVGYWLLLRFARTEGIPERIMDRVALYSAIGVMVGARLGHCFVYEPAYFFAHPIEVLYIWQGGLASHGGGVGVLIGMWLVSRREKVSMLWIMDRLIIPIALIACMIRLGNLMNSEIYGHVTDCPWGFIFVRAGETLPRHPTQIYEALSYLAVFILLMLLYYRRPQIRHRRGLLFAIFLILMFTARIGWEFLKEVQSPFEEGWLLNLGQLQSLPFLAFGIGLLVWSLRRAPATPPRFATPASPKKQKGK